MTETYPNADNHGDQEGNYIQASIVELLPRYYETHEGISLKNHSIYPCRWS